MSNLSYSYRKCTSSADEFEIMRYSVIISLLVCCVLTCTTVTGFFSVSSNFNIDCRFCRSFAIRGSNGENDESRLLACNDEIKMLRKQGNFPKALELFESMPSKGIEPDVVTYIQIIRIYGQIRQPDIALSFLAVMQTQGLSPNVKAYSAAISACEKGGQWEEALRLLELMQAKGQTPDVITFSAAISACNKGGRWQEALRLLDEMQAKGVTPNEYSYSSAISACEKNGEIVSSTGLIKSALEAGLFVNCMSYSSSNFSGGGLEKLDLHGLLLDTAKAIVRHFLDNHYQHQPREAGQQEQRARSHKRDVGADTVVLIVTGKGNHILPDGRRGVLREEIRAFVEQDLQLEATLAANNSGALLVTVRRVDGNERLQ